MSDDPKRRPVPGKGLGRGLAALMGDTAPRDGEAATPRGGVREIPIEQLKPNPYQPRKIFNTSALEELARSVKEKGLLQPLLVRRARDGQGYEIVAGERRWRAAQLAQLHAVPVVIKEITDRDALEIGLIENVQREDLNPLEEAGAFQRLHDEFGYSQDQIAQVIGKSRSHVTNTLRLLQLPKSVQEMISRGQLTAGQARPLIGHALAEQLAQRIAEGSLTVRQAEKLVAVGREIGTEAAAKKGGRPSKTPAPTGNAAPVRKDPDTLAFERGLTAALGLKAEIETEPGNPEAGRLVLHYQTLEQLDELAKKLSRR
ncbi:ParB/RepB/Spo0J family partition protein [uncultured Ferrovibrio sp.]|jgi:ParB family chromosome partitioning protein|uniref:ParB/RepB/Spo0J family partition protein n=1 Tax=uncultured Ferrovibrio sp. TaxID=1576913 RepID=UPI002627F35F|nr:ParB/RepB/Spo0J family partition protein [uncultured Ferrovibrio sp.]